MTRSVLRVLAWLSIAGIVIVTDGPIGWRPVTYLPTNLERALALSTVAFLFALAYPARLLLLAVALTLAVGVIELGQLTVLGRHASLRDVGFKTIGVMIGVFAGYVVNAAVYYVSNGVRMTRPP